MDALILTGLLAVVAKNLVETLKHLSNVGGSFDGTYTRLKGLYSLGAPVLLAILAFVAQNQGASVDLLSQLGVDTGSSSAFAAIMTGVIAGFAAPEAYDVQGLLKAKVKTNTATGAAIEASMVAQMSDPAV